MHVAQILRRTRGPTQQVLASFDLTFLHAALFTPLEFSGQPTTHRTPTPLQSQPQTQGASKWQSVWGQGSWAGSVWRNFASIN